MELNLYEIFISPSYIIFTFTEHPTLNFLIKLS